MAAGMLIISHTHIVLTCSQSLSSITEFPNLIATIQTLRNLNPLQVYSYGFFQVGL